MEWLPDYLGGCGCSPSDGYTLSVDSWDYGFVWHLGWGDGILDWTDAVPFIPSLLNKSVTSSRQRGDDIKIVCAIGRPQTWITVV